MSGLKNAWLTKHDGELASLSLESKAIEPKYMRIKAEENIFPKKQQSQEAVGKPQRHVICIKLLSLDDLEMLEATIGEYLDNYREGI